MAFFIHLVVLAVKEKSNKKKRPEKGRVCVDNLHFFSLEDSSQCSESPASTVCDWAEPYCRIGLFETLSSFVNIVIFWYPFLLLIMLHSTHFPWFQIEGVWGFFCRFYIFIFYFWCIINKLGFACHRAIAIKKCQGILDWDWCLCVFLSGVCDLTWCNIAPRCVKTSWDSHRNITDRTGFITEQLGECCPLLDQEISLGLL